MKETIKINLNQRLFDLDADAYERLKKYLDSLGQFLRKSDDGAEEILQDIEQRIAEILTEKLQKDKQVITLEDIDEVIHLMGTAEDFAQNYEPADESENRSFSDGKDEIFDRESRRLFRDTENNMIGGVCSGLAAYFNVDPVWIRLAFVILFFINLVGLIIYLILWVVVPPAITTAQKLQMRGIPVTIGNIHDSVKSEFNRVKDNFRNYTKSENYRRTRDSLSDIFNVLGNILLIFLKIILIVFGVSMVILIIAAILVFTGVFTATGLWDGWHIHGVSDWDFIKPVFHDITLFSVAIFTVVLVPVIAILTAIIKFIFNIKSRNNILAAFAWTIWSLALVLVIINLLSGSFSFSMRHQYKESFPIEIPDNTTLYITANENSLDGSAMSYYTVFGKDIIHDKWDDDCYLVPEVAIKTSDDKEPNIEVSYFSAFGFENKWMDRDFDFNWKINDSTLFLDKYFRVDDEDFWTIPGIIITIYIPDSQVIYLDRNLSEMIRRDDPPYNDLRFNTFTIMDEDRFLLRE